MENQIIQSLTKNFESFVNTTENGIEFWFARDLQHLLGYDKWDNFINVISKAKTACDVSGQLVSDHFADVGKTIKMPKTAEKRGSRYHAHKVCLLFNSPKWRPTQRRDSFRLDLFCCSDQKI